MGLNDEQDTVDVDVEFNDDDMNDPDLLAQLAEFGDSENENEINVDDEDGDEKMFEEMQNKSLLSIKQKIKMVQEKCITFKKASDSINYKLCTQSLKELKILCQQIEEMDAIDFATDKSEIDVQIKSVFDKIASLSTQKQQSQHQSKQSIEIQNALNIEDKEATEQCLLQRYRMYRFAAKKAKDSGNKATAIEYIKQSKLIKNCIEQIREGLVIWTSDIPPILDNELWNIASVQKQNVSIKQQKQKQQIEKISKAQKCESNEEYATESMIASRIREYRILCVKAKKDGNIKQAKVYLREFKEMEKMISLIKLGKFKIKVSDLPNIQSNENENKNQKIQVQQRRLSKVEQNDYSKLIKQLKKQIEECQSDASFLKTN